MFTVDEEDSPVTPAPAASQLMATIDAFVKSTRAARRATKQEGERLFTEIHKLAAGEDFGNDRYAECAKRFYCRALQACVVAAADGRANICVTLVEERMFKGVRETYLVAAERACSILSKGGLRVDLRIYPTIPSWFDRFSNTTISICFV